MQKVPLPKYNEDLHVAIQEEVNETPKAKVHRVEWHKVCGGEPVQINPSVGQGYRIMSVEEWSARWKRNEDFPGCLSCGSTQTKEHYFTQTWCRGKKWWESEAICLNCLKFSWRGYYDPDFLTPEMHEKQRWEEMARLHTTDI